MEHISNSVIGTTTGKESFEYTWRDVALYALGVGAKEDHIEYFYEDGLKVIPTFGVVPYWGTFGISPYRAIPRNVTYLLNFDRQGSLHMAHKLIIHKPINPNGEKLTIEDVITDVFDRGVGKGSVVRSALTAYNEDGEKIFTNIGDTLFSVYSAEGFPMFPKSEVVYPEREPDFVEKDYIAPNQNLIYRLSGDTNLLHVDINEAHQQGFEKPIMQGLCSFGYVCRIAIDKFIPYEPERMKSIEAQIRSPIYPGTDIEVRLWKIDDNKAYFRVVNLQTSQIILEKGMFEWK